MNKVFPFSMKKYYFRNMNKVFSFSTEKYYFPNRLTCKNQYAGSRNNPREGTFSSNLINHVTNLQDRILVNVLVKVTPLETNTSKI